MKYDLRYFKKSRTLSLEKNICINLLALVLNCTHFSFAVDVTVLKSLCRGCTSAVLDPLASILTITTVGHVKIPPLDIFF